MTGHLASPSVLAALAALLALPLLGSNALLVAPHTLKHRYSRRAHGGATGGRKKAPEVNAIPSVTCRFKACNLYDEQAPRVFVNEHGDGAGHRLKNVIDGMAVAQKNKMNFGGIYSIEQNHLTEHLVDFVKLVGQFFGNASYDPNEFFFYRKKYIMTAKYDSFLIFERNKNKFNASANIFLPSINGFPSVNVSEYYTDEFRTILRQPFDSLPLKFASNKVTVAIHLRRGDLTKNDVRITPDSFYYEIVDRIRDRFPNATDIHVWSSTYPGINKPHQITWNSTDFDGYRTRGIQVHLDDVDVMEPWAHLARAAIYIMGASSFSYIPAVLNQNCVIYPGHQASPLSNWMDGREPTRDSYGKEFEACMARAAQVKDTH